MKILFIFIINLHIKEAGLKTVIFVHVILPDDIVVRANILNNFSITLARIPKAVPLNLIPCILCYLTLA